MGEVVNEATPASFTAAMSTTFRCMIIRETCCLTVPYCHSSLCRGLFDNYSTCAVHLCTRRASPLGVLLHTVTSTTWCDVQSSATVQSCGYSSMLACSANWIAVVPWRRLVWGHTSHKRVDISMHWAKAHLQKLVATWSTAWHSEKSRCLFLPWFHMGRTSLKDDSTPANKLSVSFLDAMVRLFWL